MTIPESEREQLAAFVLTSVWDQVAVLESLAPSVIHLERIAI